jgi:hypothetical protein
MKGRGRILKDSHESLPFVVLFRFVEMIVTFLFRLNAFFSPPFFFFFFSPMS